MRRSKLPGSTNDEAELLFQRAIAVSPHPNVLKDAANFYSYSLGDKDRAEPLLRRALELDPGHANTLRALAKLLACARSLQNTAGTLAMLTILEFRPVMGA